MYTLIYDGTVNTFEDVAVLNLAVVSILFDHPNYVVETCHFSKTTMIYEPSEIITEKH